MLKYVVPLLLFISCPLFAKAKLNLNLDDTILLAVRDNPNVQSARLNDLSQKFNLWVQEWQFRPHYSLQVNASYSRNTNNGYDYNQSHNYAAQPSITLLTPIGTQLGLNANNVYAGHYNPSLSLQIMQPLMRGFGKAIVESALNNAKDTDVISKLSIEAVLRNTVSTVIDSYLNVVSAQQAVKIDEDALKRAEQSVTQTKLFIKAGHKAGNELVTVKADVASAQSQLENDKNNLSQARYALLTAIGIDPNTNVDFSVLDLNALLKKYHQPSLEQCKKTVLENDIQYQIDTITLNGPTRRSLMVAQDNARWQLNINANVATGNDSGIQQNAGLNNLFTSNNQTQTLSLSLQVPIDDQLSKQAIVNAKIALKQAKIALLQEKWNKETSAINAWNLVSSAERALHFAENAESLQNKTYQLSYQKYLHGLIDSLALQQAQLQLIQAQQSLLSSRIAYIKSLVNLDLLTGHTLKTWNIQVRM